MLFVPSKPQDTASCRSGRELGARTLSVYKYVYRLRCRPFLTNRATASFLRANFGTDVLEHSAPNVT